MQGERNHHRALVALAAALAACDASGAPSTVVAPSPATVEVRALAKVVERPLADLLLSNVAERDELDVERLRVLARSSPGLAAVQLMIEAEVRESTRARVHQGEDQ